MSTITFPESTPPRFGHSIGIVLLSLASLAGCGAAPGDDTGTPPAGSNTAPPEGSHSESALNPKPSVVEDQVGQGNASPATPQNSDSPEELPGSGEEPRIDEAIPAPPPPPPPENEALGEEEVEAEVTPPAADEPIEEEPAAESESLVGAEDPGSDDMEPADLPPVDAEDPNNDEMEPEDVAPPAVDAQGDLEPLIPSPVGPCQEFRSGQQTIMGLSTEIVAGTPGETKGPILFNWHGTGGNGAQALAQLPQSVQRDIVERGGIIIAPTTNGQVRDGQDVTSFLRVWYDGADLEYADHIVACAVQNHNIDPRQVYATGCSAGGLMAGVMALKRSSYVAAVAPNSGGVATPTDIEDPTRIPAVLAMHGGSGDNVIVNFGDTSQSLFDILAPFDAFLVECNHNAGHCGASGALHENAWEFMKSHPFGTDTSPFAGGLPAEFPDFCEIQ